MATKVTKKNPFAIVKKFGIYHLIFLSSLRLSSFHNNFLLRDYLHSLFRIFFPFMICPTGCFSKYLQLLPPPSGNILRHVFVDKFWDYLNHTANLFLDFWLSSDLTSYLNVTVNPELIMVFHQPNLNWSWHSVLRLIYLLTLHSSDPLHSFSSAYPLQHILLFVFVLPTENVFTTEDFPTTSVTEYFCLNSISADYFPLSIISSL